MITLENLTTKFIDHKNHKGAYKYYRDLDIIKAKEVAVHNFKTKNKRFLDKSISRDKEGLFLSKLKKSTIEILENNFTKIWEA